MAEQTLAFWANDGEGYLNIKSQKDLKARYAVWMHQHLKKKAGQASNSVDPTMDEEDVREYLDDVFTHARGMSSQLGQEELQTFFAQMLHDMREAETEDKTAHMMPTYKLHIE